MTAYELIKKYGWIQGDYGSEETGFCVLGALSKAYHGIRKYRKAKEKVRAVIGIHIPDWNDSEDRTKRQVLAVLKKAGV